MKCERGFCICCDKAIFKKCDSCNASVPTEDYTEIQLNWSNGSKMQMAVCVDCSKDKIWKADKQELTQAVWDAWDKAGATYSKEVTII